MSESDVHRRRDAILRELRARPDRWLVVGRTGATKYTHGLLRAAPLDGWELLDEAKDGSIGLGYVGERSDLLAEYGAVLKCLREDPARATEPIPEPVAGRLRALDADFERVFAQLASGARMWRHAGSGAFLCGGGRCWSTSRHGREIRDVGPSWVVHCVRAAIWEGTPVRLEDVPAPVRRAVAVASDRDRLFDLLTRGAVRVWLVGARYGKSLRFEEGRVLEAYPTGEYEESSPAPTIDPAEIFAERECPPVRLRALLEGAEGHAVHEVHFLAEGESRGGA